MYFIKFIEGRYSVFFSFFYLVCFLSNLPKNEYEEHKQGKEYGHIVHGAQHDK